MPPRALPCRPDALPFDRVVRIAVREQSTMDRDCVALFVSPRTTFLELACGCSAAAARSPAVSLRGLLRGRPTHRHLPYGAVWIDISVLVPRTARPARLSSVPVVAERPAAGSVPLGGSHPKKDAFGFNSYDPRIDPRHPGRARTIRPSMMAAPCSRPADPAPTRASRWARTSPRSASARRLRDRSSAHPVRTAWHQADARGLPREGPGHRRLPVELSMVSPAL